MPALKVMDIILVMEIQVAMLTRNLDLHGNISTMGIEVGQTSLFDSFIKKGIF